MAKLRGVWWGLTGVLVLIVGLGLWLLVSLRPPAGPMPVATAFTLRNVTLVNPMAERRPGVSIRIADSRIASIGTTEAGNRVDDGLRRSLEPLAGSYALPGLVDAHHHLPADTPLGLTDYFGILLLAHGVTAVRDAGDLDGTSIAAAKRVYELEGGAGPRVSACGPFVGAGEARWANSWQVEQVGDADRIIERLIDEGYRCVKAYDGLDRPRLRALLDAAERRRLPVMGHVPFGMVFEEAGLPDTQHLMGVARPEQIAAGDHVIHRVSDWREVEPERYDEIVEASRSRGLAHTPTLTSAQQLLHRWHYAEALRDPVVQLMPPFFVDVVWHPVEGLSIYARLTPEDELMVRDSLAKKLQLVGRLHEAGVPLRIGTDTQQPFVVPGAAVHGEMRLFHEAGIPVEAVLAYATRESARPLGITGLGELREGAPADLVLYREDPTRDLEALDTIEAVVAAGRLYWRADLEAAIARFRSYYESGLVRTVASAVARRRMAAAVTSDH